jgi:hypothetical protein
MAKDHLMSPENKFEKYSASHTWFLIATEVFFLVFFIGFMYFPWPNPVIRLEKHSDRVGSLYSQIDYKSFMARLIPLLFILKRIFFAVGCWFLKTELVAIFGFITLLHICLIVFAKPYLENS